MVGLNMMMVCVPNVAPAIMERVIRTESQGNPLTLNVNVKWVMECDGKRQPIMVTDKDGQSKPKRRKVMFRWPTEVGTKQDAIIITYAVMASRFTIDMNYMQANSSNLLALDFTAKDMFDDCKNLAADTNVLSAFHARALKKYPDPRTALRVVLSAYNTGDFNKGCLNGYLACYGIGNPAMSVPVINSCTVDTTMFVCQPPKKEEIMSTRGEASNTQQIAEPVEIMAPCVDPAVSQSQENSATPGVQVEHTAGVAEANGAFHETAMSKSDAWESSADLADDPSGMAIMLEGKAARPVASCSAADLAKAQSVKGGNQP